MLPRALRTPAALATASLALASTFAAAPMALASPSAIPCDGQGTAVQPDLWVYNAASLQSRKPVGTGGTNLILNGDFEQTWPGDGTMYRLRPAGTTNASPSNPEQYQAIPSWSTSGGGPTATSDTYGGWGDMNLYEWDPNHSTLADPTYGGAPGRSMVYFGNDAHWSWDGSKPTFVGAGSGKAAIARPTGSLTFANGAPAAFGTNATPVTVTQTVTGLTVGQSYRLQFWQSSEDAAEANGRYTRDGLSAVDITGFQRTFLVIPHDDQQYTLDFIATAANTTIGFMSWGHVDLSLEPGTGNSLATELVLDDVILTECASVTGTRPAYVPTVTAVDDYYVGLVNQQIRGAAGDLDIYDSGAAFTKLTNPANGTIQFGNDGTFTFTPTAGWTGQTSFTYKVCLPGPNTSVCATATEYIVVGGPVDDYYTTPYETPLTTGYAPAGDTVPPMTNGSAAWFQYDRDASGPVSYPGFTAPQHGTVTWGTDSSYRYDGTFVYTPDPGFSGTDTFTYQLCVSGPAPNYDSICATATEHIIVPGPGATIAAVNDSYTTPKNTPMTAGAAGRGDTYPAGSMFTKLGDPQFGTVTWNADGTFTYTPNANFVGVDSFPYEVCEPAPNQTVCAVATEIITVPPDGVSIDAIDASYTTPMDTPMTTGSASADDTYRKGSSFARMSQPKHGTVSGWNSTTGSYTYTPDAGWYGTDSFTYRVCLPEPNQWVCDMATETITVPGPTAPPAPAPASPAPTAPAPVTTPWTLSYAGEGGACTTPWQTVPNGAVAVVGDGSGTCARPGFLFAGWATEPGLPASVPAGTPYTMTRDVVLYATWTAGGPKGPSRPVTPPFIRDFGVTTAATVHVFNPLKAFTPSKGAKTVSRSLQIGKPGSKGWKATVTIPGKGTFTVTKGKVVFTGVPGWQGTTRIRYRAMDTSRQWAASTLTVLVAKVPGTVNSGR